MKAPRRVGSTQLLAIVAALPALARRPDNPLVSRHVAPCFRLDLRAEYEFWDGQASVALGVRNLLDSNHYEGGTLFLNDAEVPRMIYAKFKVVIK